MKLNRDFGGRAVGIAHFVLYLKQVDLNFTRSELKDILYPGVVWLWGLVLGFSTTVEARKS